MFGIKSCAVQKLNSNAKLEGEVIDSCFKVSSDLNLAYQVDFFASINVMLNVQLMSEQTGLKRISKFIVRILFTFVSIYFSRNSTIEEKREYNRQKLNKDFTYFATL